MDELAGLEHCYSQVLLLQGCIEQAEQHKTKALCTLLSLARHSPHPPTDTNNSSNNNSNNSSSSEALPAMATLHSADTCLLAASRDLWPWQAVVSAGLALGEVTPINAGVDAGFLGSATGSEESTEIEGRGTGRRASKAAERKADDSARRRLAVLRCDLNVGVCA